MAVYDNPMLEPTQRIAASQPVGDRSGVGEFDSLDEASAAEQRTRDGNYWQQRLLYAAGRRLRLTACYLRKLRWRALGMRVGDATSVEKITANWPAQVQVGKHCTLCRGIAFDFCHGAPRPGPNIAIGDRCYVGRGVEFNIRRSVRIGSDCLIAAGVRFIDHDHGIDAGRLIRTQIGAERPIVLGDDVWIGANVVVLKGVTIGDGAVIGAGAVVTRDVPDNEIWAGLPARCIGRRTEHGPDSNDRTTTERDGVQSLLAACVDFPHRIL